jgi:hypothetical protein
VVERTVAALARSMPAEAATAAVVVGLAAGLPAQQPARLPVRRGPYETTVYEGLMMMEVVVDRPRRAPTTSACPSATVQASQSPWVRSKYAPPPATSRPAV